LECDGVKQRPSNQQKAIVAGSEVKKLRSAS